MVSSNSAASRSSVCSSPLENPLGTRLAATSPSWVVVFCWRSSAAGCSSPNSCRNGHRRGRRCVRRRDGALPDSQRPALDAGTFGSKRHRIAPRGPPPSAGSGRHERRPAEPHSAHPGPDSLGPLLVHLSHVVTEMTPHTRRRHLPLPLEVGCFDGRQELPLRGQRFAVGETDLDTTPQFGARTCVDPRPRRRTRDGHRLNTGRAWLSEWG